MAYVDTGLLEEDSQQDAGGPLVPGSGASGSPAASPNAPTPSKQKTPSNFADLSEYLRVNSPQAFGSQVAGKIGQDITQGGETLSNATGEFKNRADAATVTDNQGLIGQVSTSPETVDKQAFTGLRDAEYKGPESFSDSQDLFNQAAGSAGAAVGKANAAKTEGGRFSLLDNYFGRPSYSRGQKSLDNLLIQNDDNSKQAFSQMQQNANQLQQQVHSTGQDLDQYGAAAKATTAATRDAARGALTSGTQKLQDETQAQYDSRIAQQNTDETALRDALATKDFSRLTAAQREELGTQANGMDSYYRVDPTRYLSKPELNVQNTATPEQQRRAAALANLSDTQNTLLPDETAVGAYDTENPVGYDFSQLTNAVQGGRQQYEAQRNTPTAVIGTNVPGFSGIAPTEFGVLMSQNPQLYSQVQAMKSNQLAGPAAVQMFSDIIAKAQAQGFTSIIPGLQGELDRQKSKLNDVDAYWGVNNAAALQSGGTVSPNYASNG